MRDQQHRTAREERADALEQFVLSPWIEGGRGLIQDHERGPRLHGTPTLYMACTPCTAWETRAAWDIDVRCRLVAVP
jgi:hypothetical protein